MERIVIIGVTGSGKSTLAKRLAEKLRYPVIELDDLHWSPGWVAADKEVFRQTVARAASAGKWVAVGNYSIVSDLLWSRADTLIWLDVSLPRALGRLVRRTIQRARNNEAVCNGNYETIARAFSKDSIILWLFKSYFKKKREFGVVFRDKNQPGIRNYVRLRTLQETESFLSLPPV